MFIFYDSGGNLCTKAYVLNMAEGSYYDNGAQGFVFEEEIGGDDEEIKWAVHSTTVAHIESLANLQFPQPLRQSVQTSLHRVY